MLERKIEFRRILIFDFSGAFLAGIIYLLILTCDLNILIIDN